MKKTLRVSTFTILLVTFLSLPEIADACSCLREESPCQAFSGTTAIFVGKVVGAIQQNEAVNQDGSRTSYDVGSIRFEVQEAFVGVSGSEVVIHSGTGGGDCGYWFKRGEVYLVYGSGKPNSLSTNICTRTRPIGDAKEDLAFLRSLPARGVGGTLYGSVNRYSGDLEHGPSSLVGPVTGIKVRAKSDKTQVETVTDQEGQYRITALPPGSYDISIELPQNLGAIAQGDTADRFGSYSGGEKKRIYDRGCTQNNFSLFLDGRIGGRLTNADGKPMKDAEVDLILVDSPDKGWSAWSDADGYYEFRMVQPGRYFLGINLEWSPNGERPYPRTYYPGVKEEHQARVLSVSEGTRLSNHNIVFPPRLIERKVEGIVAWPDGRPAKGALVGFELSDYAGKSFPQHAEVDDKGAFVVKLFDGLHYTVLANIQEPRGKYTHSDLIILIPSEQTEKVKLELKNPGNGYENWPTRKKSQ